MRNRRLHCPVPHRILGAQLRRSEPVLRPSLKLLVPAAAVALLAAAPSTGRRRDGPGPAARPSAALRGSVQPSVAHSALIGKAVPTTSVRVSLVLRPAHAGLLRNMAAHSSGGTALSQSLMERLFRPSAATQARIAAYMRARGFRPLGRGVLTMSFAGTARQGPARVRRLARPLPARPTAPPTGRRPARSTCRPRSRRR